MKKFAAVFGASGDIGSQIAEKLVADGWSLYLHYASNRVSVDEMIDRWERQHPNQEFISLQADFSDELAVRQMLEQLYSVQTLIFASGISSESLIEDVSLQELDKLYTVHLRAPIQIIQHLSTKLRRMSNASIVLVGSIWGDTGAANEVMYSAIKGAQHSFVKALAKEFGPSKIRVNAVSPGFIHTKMTAHYEVDVLESIRQEIPLMKFGDASDVAEAVQFLVSEKSSYITGQIIRVNGGWYI